MNEVLFETLKAALVLAVILLARYAVPYIKMKLEDSRQAWVVQWVEVAVKSAEQTISGPGKGKDKKDAVIKFIREQLLKKGMPISDEQLSNLIEAAVFAMNGGK